MMRIALALGLTCVVAGTASADRRMFTYTFEYRTVPLGNTTIALWHTESRARWAADSPQSLEHMLQIAHGLTDRLDASVYTLLTQVSAPDEMEAEPLRFHEIRLQARYRFADRSEWPLDVQLHGEVAKQYSARTFDAQLRGVIARDFDKVTMALNVIGVVRAGADLPKTDFDLGWTAGTTYEVHPKLNAGVEAFGVIESDATAVIGPAIAVAPSSKLWLTFTAGFGLTDESPKVSGRAILGIEL